jgi:YVTN family beta-propeller protein
MNTSVPPGTSRIFISYRREDSAFPAGWLYDRLAEHFGDAQVFKDVDSIRLGDDFVEAIRTAVGSCAVLLALIGAKWLTVTDNQGRRRLNDPEDFVRLEIEAGLARKVRVIPVIMEGARMPSAAELPASLRELAFRQALELRPNRFKSDTSHLLRVLDDMFVQRPGLTRQVTGPPRASNGPWTRPLSARWTAIAALAVAAAIAGSTYAALPSAPPAGPGGGTRSAGVPPAVRTHRAAPGAPITVGSHPDWIAITQNGKTAYVTDGGDGTVTPINLLTKVPGAPIKVGNRPSGIAITPDGKTAYVTNQADGTVTPVNLATGTPGQPITVGRHPYRIAITPDGKTAYVTNQADGTVTPVDLATDIPGHPIFAGNAPQAIVITPDGTTAYVANHGANTITPISLPAGIPGAPVTVGYHPDEITISPDGKTAYTTGNGFGAITPVELAAGRDGRTIMVSSPAGIAITPDGKTAYIANYAAGTVTPMTLPSGTTGTPVKVGSHPDAIVITPDGKTAYVTNNSDGTVTPITLPAVQARPAPSADPSQHAPSHAPPASSPAPGKTGFPGSVRIPMSAACKWAYPGKADGRITGSQGSIACLAANGHVLGGFNDPRSLSAWCADPRHTDGRHMSGATLVHEEWVWVCIP